MAACDLQSYCERIPEENRSKLDKQIDFEHDGVPTHLGAIADAMDEWEGCVAEALGLSKANVSAIKTKHPDNLNLQTRDALHRWQEKNGLEATYRNLIEVFLKAGKTSYAEAVCKVLGMDSKLEVAMAELSTSDDVTAKQSSTGVARKKSYGNEKKELLKVNLANIKKSFGSLKRQVLHILKGKDIDMDEFAEFVMELIPPGYIEDAENIATIFKAISTNLLWSHSDYRILKSIAQEFAVEDTEQLIDHYERELASFYATTRLVDYIDLCQDEDVLADPEEPLAPNPAKYNREHFQKLTIKIGRRVTDETLQYAADLWKEVSKFFGLPSLVAVLDCVLAGSLVISWIIPCLAAMQIRMNSTGSEAEAFYRSHQIIEVKIEDECLYCHSDTTTDDTTKFALLKACEEGNLDQVLELVERLSDFDFSQTSHTPLTAAVRSSAAIDIIQVLLLYQFDVNGRNENGATALMVASLQGRTDVVKLLIQHNADVNAREENGVTALMVAIHQGRTDVVKLLIQHNADMNAKTEDGVTALMMASHQGRTDVVELLIQHNADVNARDEDCATALMMASQEGRTDVVELLIQHNADVNARAEDGGTALMVASLQERTDVVELLIQHNADVNARAEGGVTAMKLASHQGRTDVMELLIQHNADVNAREEDGVTALMMASHQGRTDVMELLIQHNADVNARMENGVTALMLASQEGRTDVVELLIQHNADVNARTEDGFTALVCATLKGNVESVRTLLEAGADPNITENETNWTSLFFASKDGREDLVTLLLDHGAEVDHKDKNGITALVTARTYNHTVVIDLLMAFSMSLETTAETIPPAELSEETRQHVIRAGDYNQKRFEKQMFFKKITDYRLPGRARERGYQQT